MDNVTTLIEGKLYLVDDFLAPSEVEHYRAYLDQREKDYTGVHPMPHRWQESIDDPQLSITFWQKLKPYFTQISPLTKYQRKHSPYLKEPYKCAKYMPAVRYNIDGLQTIIHQDFRRDPQEEFAVIIYLNQDFPDGQTRYYDHYRQLLHTIKPKTGQAIIFDIEMFHRGEAPNGIKYILCPRVCYRNLSNKTKKPKINKPKTKKLKRK